MDRNEISIVVSAAIVDSLGVEPEEVEGDVTLLDDLGAESIDLLDILLRLERSIGVKIAAADVAAYIQGGIPEEEFGSEDETVSVVGLRQLKKVMPQIDIDELIGTLPGTAVMTLFTVDNLIDLVVAKAAAAAVAAAA